RASPPKPTRRRTTSMGIDKVSLPSRLTAGTQPGTGKKSIIAGAIAAVVAGASPAYAEIELGEGFSVTGFVDMSFYDVSDDGASGSFGIDQFETDFMFAGSDGVSAQVDIEYSK